MSEPPKQPRKRRKRKMSRTAKFLTRNLPPINPLYYFEETVKDLRESDISNHGIFTAEVTASTVRGKLKIAEVDIEYKKQLPPLYPVAWGWNSGGRAGNITEFEIFKPKQVQKSISNNYIGSAAGASHSLIVSDEGNVFSFGEGRYGQLGYGNQFSNEHPKGGVIQAYPRAVGPSGGWNKGRDIKVVQVGCGGTFSLAREVCPVEGVSLRRGLRQTEQALAALLRVYGDAEVLHRAMADVKQERFSAAMLSMGVVTSWGMGNHGELGLGKYVTMSPSPLAIPRFRNMRIIQIAAGPEHVLAINSKKQLFSWGRGQSGRLGLSDFEDRYAPEYVSFYKSYNVEYCAAGYAHSAVLITNISVRGVQTSAQLRRLSTFGRGYHGRLGNGTNRNSCVPVAVTEWPPSMKGLQIRQVACGGAHTLVLLEKPVPIGLASPWGVQTIVGGFGYGGSGSLGTGYTALSFVPLKTRMPKCEPVVEISAGKTWSLARTINGDAYAWGKGLRGQLGLGDGRKFSLVPVKIECFGSFVGIEGAGYAHNVGIIAPKKHLTEKLQTSLANEWGRASKSHDAENEWGRGGAEGVSKNHDSYGTEESNPAFEPYVPVALKQRVCDSLYAFDCCRRHVGAARASLRYSCEDCGISCICHTCAKLCHSGHNLISRDLLVALEAEEYGVKEDVKDDDTVRGEDGMKGEDQGKGYDEEKDEGNGVKVTQNQNRSGNQNEYKKFVNQKGKVRRKTFSCRCGLFNDKCRSLPAIPEAYDENTDKKGLLAIRMNIAARVIQRAGMRRVARYYAEKAKKKLVFDRLAAASAYYNNVVLGSIWKKVTDGGERRSQAIETGRMAAEDSAMNQWDTKIKLQKAISAMDSMLFAIKNTLGKMSIYLPRMRNRVVRDRKTGFRAEGGRKASSIFSLADTTGVHPITPMVTTEILRPSLAFSWISVREQQLRLAPRRRVPSDILAEAARQFPFYDPLEGRVADMDVNMFFTTHLRDVPSERRRQRQTDRLAAVAAEEERLAAVKRRVNMAEKSHKAALFARAAAIANGTSHFVADDTQPREVIRAEALAVKVAAAEAEDAAILRREDLEDSSFEQQYHTNSLTPVITPGTKAPPSVALTVTIARRNSISDPCHMYSRVVAVNTSIALRAIAKRRLSTPNTLPLAPAEHPCEERVEGVRKSLSSFHRRLRLLNGFLDPKYQNTWAALSNTVRLARLQKTLAYAWLTPRLPCEMLQMLNNVNRRRTVGEPERLSKQLFIMFETRNAFSKLRVQSRRVDRMFVRRRSFDMGEEADGRDDITNSIGYEYEERYVVPTLVELRDDSTTMGSRILLSGYDLNDIAQKKAKKKLAQKAQASALRSAENKALRAAAAAEQAAAKGARDSKGSLAGGRGGGGGGGGSVEASAAETAAIEQKAKEEAAAAEAARQGLVQFDAKRFMRSKPVKEDVAVLPIAGGEAGGEGEEAEVWNEHYGEDGQAYYYRPLTGESSWDYPIGEGVQIESQYQDAGGSWYWYNNTTGDTRWS